MEDQKQMIVRAAIAAVLLFAMPGAAMADEACGPGASSKLLTVQAWTIKPNPDGLVPGLKTNHMTETLSYSGAKAIRLVRGVIDFKDVLGDNFGAMAIDGDTHIKPGGIHQQAADWGPESFARLLDIDHADVVATACVSGVVYADGTIEHFP